MRAKGYGEEALGLVRERLCKEDSVARLVALLEKRRVKRPTEEKSLLSLAASLVRYGYSSGEIKGALAQYFGE